MPNKNEIAGWKKLGKDKMKLRVGKLRKKQMKLRVEKSKMKLRVRKEQNEIAGYEIAGAGKSKEIADYEIAGTGRQIEPQLCVRIKKRRASRIGDSFSSTSGL